MRTAAPLVLRDPSAARLLIHPAHAGGATTPMRSWLARAQAALGTWHGRGAHTRQPARLQIDDLDGRCHFSAEFPPAAIDLALPAGTYHITLQQGALQRRYTVALEEGRTVDLELPPAAASMARSA